VFTTEALKYREEGKEELTTDFTDYTDYTNAEFKSV
jgi:hypothetical protein